MHAVSQDAEVTIEVGANRRPAVFLDRDGVLDELVPEPGGARGESPLDVPDVALIAGAAQAAADLRDAGYLLAVVTNQPAAAKGTRTVQQLQAVQARVVDLLAAEAVVLDGWRICLHHPDGSVPELSGACACRKPAPGMLLELAEELQIELGRSWMIGDTDADVLAGRAAGCRTVLLRNRLSGHKRSGSIDADLVAEDLRAAAELVVACVD